MRNEHVRYSERHSASRGGTGCASTQSPQFRCGGSPMSRAYNVIDADGHILEPLDLWAKYMDPKFRDRAPRLVVDNKTGKEKLLVEAQLLGSEQGMGGIGGVGARQGAVKAAALQYAD